MCGLHLCERYVCAGVGGAESVYFPVSVCSGRCAGLSLHACAQDKGVCSGQRVTSHTQMVCRGAHFYVCLDSNLLHYPPRSCKHLAHLPAGARPPAAEKAETAILGSRGIPSSGSEITPKSLPAPLPHMSTGVSQARAPLPEHLGPQLWGSRSPISPGGPRTAGSALGLCLPVNSKVRGPLPVAWSPRNYTPGAGEG